MGPGQHLDRLDQFGVTGYVAMVVAIGPDQIGQHLGITPVGLRVRHAMALPVTGRCQRVHRIDLIANRDQRPHQQSPVQLDPPSHLAWVLGVLGNQPMQLRHPGDTVADPAPAKNSPAFVEHAHVVMGFGPVDARQRSSASSFTQRHR